MTDQRTVQLIVTEAVVDRLIAGLFLLAVQETRLGDMKAARRARLDMHALRRLREDVRS